MATVSLDKAVDQLNSLLRGEISAVETYKQAIKKVDDEHTSDALALRAMAQEHGEHAQALREEIRRLGGEPDDSSGAWGAWAKTVEATAKLFGERHLKALKEGRARIEGLQAAFDYLDVGGVFIATRLIPASSTSDPADMRK